MSVLVNLLPEARILKLKAVSQRRFMTTLTIVVGVVVGTILITLLLLLGYTFSTQKLNQAKISSLQSDVDKSKDLEQKASTLQEHLASFAQLQGSRLYVSEIFRNLSNVVPSGVSVTSFEISDAYVITISGTAANYAQVATFAQTLKDYNVNYKPQQGLDRKALFSEVNITTVSKESGSEKVNFTMSFKVDPTIFKKAGGGQ
ncbi:PilN domain-containing protein [Candidatus Saccharibacteria bacterium]|nr:PilN domain-containing protein [Candidatus Saccharibacteria bacterium]